MRVHKKCQPIRSSRLAGYRERIYKYLVLLYTSAEGPGVARGKDLGLENQSLWQKLNYFIPGLSFILI